MVATYNIACASSADDLDSVRELFANYAAELGWDLSSGGRLADEIERLPGPYSEPAGTLLLATVGGSSVGVLGLQPVPAEARVPDIGAETFAELKRLYVLPAYRRLGIAHALMCRAEEEARARGYTTAVLTTVAEMMPLAQGLYECLGYTPRDPYRTDILWPAIRWLGKAL